ncbi:ABC transporter permease [Deinococcus yavapaiensis]|uniref:ABC transporter permease n=1 Tax=Deinococcus yavapaiensis TaxID=309889 RepID=UPI0014756CC5|nr:ABC transporter permease subunit [Deinococcus yavapaiensis]
MWRFVGLLTLFAAWPGMTALLGPDIFPGPAETLQFLGREIARGVFWGHLGITIGRVLGAFALALLIGIPLGWWLGRSKRAYWTAESWLAAGLSAPRIMLLLVAFLLIGLNERALITAITVILLPTVVVQVREGVRALDPRLAEMAQAFRLSRGATLRWVMLPQMLPAALGTARVTLSLSWKMVVFGEVFGRTSGVGYMISFYFQQFEMRGILAYGLAMTILLAALDYAFAAFGDHAFRWKGEVA